MPTTFHLVRHAAHGLLGRVLTGRMPGVGLSTEGQAQAMRLAEHFAQRRVAAIVSSPLERAQQTAGPIAAALGQCVVTDDGLNEIDVGAWTGLTFDALQNQPEWHAWNRFRSTAPTHGGETMLAVLVRVLATIARLRKAYPDGEVMLVSHQDVLKALLAHSLGMPLDLLHRIELAPASRSTLVMFEDDVRVDGVNLT